MAAKPPLILCPGLLCDADLWRHQIEHLADVADVIVPNFTIDDSVPGMASRLLAAAPERFALAGLSMGGYVAQEVIRRAPERVTRLALLDTSARADTPEQTKRRRDLMDLAGRGRFRGVTPQLLPLLVHPDRLDDETLTRSIMAMAENVGPDAFLRQQTAIAARPDGREDLAKIACPTLVLCGRQDRLTPLEVNAEIAEAIPGADLVVLGACGHMTSMERPEATTATLRVWLTER